MKTIHIATVVLLAPDSTSINYVVSKLRTIDKRCRPRAGLTSAKAGIQHPLLVTPY
jgi:hypothetical protein